MATQPLFGLLPAGQPLITAPSSQPNPTSFLYFIPSATPSNPKPFAHLAVFLLPGIALPENTAAAIYIALNPSAFAAPGGAGSAVAAAAAAANFKFLGGVGPGKESAVFKLGGSSSSSGGGGGNNNNNSAGGTNAAAAEGGVVIGIDMEDATSVAERIQQLQQQQHQQQSQSTAVVQANRAGGGSQTQVVLAQRIIQNAFNFLSSFSGQVGESGIEVVPLKAFQEWWRKFETRIKNDPGFLERQQD